MLPITHEAGGALAAQVCGLFLRYVSAVALTNTLGVGWFGTFTLGQTLASLLATLSAAGLSPGLLPWLARARRLDDGTARAVVRGGAWIGAVSSTLVGAVLFASGPWLARAAFADHDLALVLRTFSLVVVLEALGSIGTTLVQAFCSVRRAMWITWVVGPGVSLLGFGTSWVLGLGIQGVLAAVILGALAGLLASWRLLSRASGNVLWHQASDPAPPLRAILSSSWPLLGSNLFAYVLGWMDVILMGVFQSPEEVGVYGAAARLAPVVVLVNMSIGPVFLARMSELWVRQDREGIRHLYERTGSWSLWWGVFVAALFYVFGPRVLGLFGPAFVAGAPVLALLCTGRLVSAATGMCGRMLAVTDHARLHMLNIVLMVAFNGILGLLLIPRHGALGAAIATCSSLVLVNVLQTVEVWVLFRIHPYSRRALAGLLGLSALAGIVYPWRDGPDLPGGWLVPALAFTALSVGLFWCVGAEREDREYVRGFLLLRRKDS